MAIVIPEGEMPQSVPVTADSLSTEVVEDSGEEQNRVTEASNAPEEPEHGGDPTYSAEDPV